MMTTTPGPDTSDHLGERFLATVGLLARAAVDDVVQYRIEQEYGIADAEAAAGGAATRAVIHITDDIRPLYVGYNGTDIGLRGLAEALLRQLVTAGLDARRCQCGRSDAGERGESHGHRGACEGHFEADVPPVDGMLMCGTCHGAVWRARGGVEA